MPKKQPRKKTTKKGVGQGVGGGKPPLYSDPKKLEEKIQEYFKLCEQKEMVKTVPGLAYHLGFASKQSIYDYGKDDKFSYYIKRALCHMEDGRLQQGIPAIGVMDLKNNFNYTDRQSHEHEHTGKDGGPIVVEIIRADGTTVTRKA